MSKKTLSVILWAAAGLILAAVTIGTAIYGIRSTPSVRMDQTVVLDAAEEVLTCARSGDYAALSRLLYGSPDLGTPPAETDEAQSMIWHAYLDSLRWNLATGCRPSDSGVTVDVAIRCMDISAVTEALQTLAPERMAQLAKETTNEADIYDKDKNYLPEFVAEVLRSATADVLAQPVQTMTRTLTLQLVRVEEGWQVVPTEELMHLLSGFVAE